ncbi:MAG: ABC transporter permease [Alphaproteobacteria bacterium]|nr:ABC transporter permease [Alphaproteobacteria bacterium]
MTGLLLRRAVETLITLLLITVMVFGLTRLTGDPTSLLLPPEATEATRAAFRHAYGLDQNMFVQYEAFLIHLFEGDLGESFRLHEPAIGVALDALGPTLKLACAGMALSIVLGMPFGIVAATSRRRWVKRLGRWYGSLGQALPPFWVGLILVSLLALQLPLFPTSGYGTARHYVLPALTLAVATSSSIASLTQANLEEALRSDFIHMERVLGLPEWRIVLKHALRNASLPIVTFLALQFGLILGGAIVTERVFAWPGIGQRIVEAILGRDYPVVQAIVLITATLFMLINLAADLLYLVLDPRLRT